MPAKMERRQTLVRQATSAALNSAAAAANTGIDAAMASASAARAEVADVMGAAADANAEVRKTCRAVTTQAQVPLASLKDTALFSFSRITLNKEKAKAILMDYATPLRTKLMSNMKDVITASLTDDPYMWSWFKKGLRVAVDTIWVDLEIEIERTIELGVLLQKADDDVDGPSSDFGPVNLWLRFRAFVLHHYFPHDRSLFGKLSDPVYVTIFILTLLPIHSLRPIIFSTLLFMQVWPGPPDEFQLLNYILIFKGFQFLSSGLGLAIYGATQYAMCYTWWQDTMVACVNRQGPSSVPVWGGLSDLSFNILLPWTAFSMLPYTISWGRPKRVEEGAPDQSEVAQRGGRLRSLLKYDAWCISVIVFILMVVTNFTCVDGKPLTQSRMFSSNIYWSRVVYSVFMLPFLAFTTPYTFSVLTHSDPTGFNDKGACVSWAMPTARKRQEQAPPSTYWRYKSTARQITALGMRKRAGIPDDEDEESDLDEKRGGYLDFATGLLYYTAAGRLDPEGAESVSTTWVKEPYQLLNVWDRF